MHHAGGFSGLVGQDQGIQEVFAIGCAEMRRGAFQRAPERPRDLRAAGGTGQTVRLTSFGWLQSHDIGPGKQGTGGHVGELHTAAAVQQRDATAQTVQRGAGRCDMLGFVTQVEHHAQCTRQMDHQAT